MNNDEHIVLNKGRSRHRGTGGGCMLVCRISGQILFRGVTGRKKSNLSEQQEELASTSRATKKCLVSISE